MVYLHRRPHPTARKAMAEASLDLGRDYESISNSNIYRKLIDYIGRRYGAEVCEITSSGNSAIFMALASTEGAVLVPDMGGWFSYLNYPCLLGRDMAKVRTEDGIIDVNHLDEILEFYGEPSTLILHTLAGYMAPQPMKEIKQICEMYGLSLIHILTLPTN